MKQILSKLRRAAQDFAMIRPHDVICVGVSGGKDSMMLLKALSVYRRFSPEPFELKAICLDMGFGADLSDLWRFCEELGVDLEIIPTDIGRIVFEQREEKNPCALCAKLKRGALHTAALHAGSHKLALGHHMDDAVETFFLSLFYEGRIHTFSPLTYLDRTGVTVIRPLIYLREKDIIYAANKERLPVIKSRCPADKNTKREDMKNFFKQISRQIPGGEACIVGAVADMMKKRFEDID